MDCDRCGAVVGDVAKHDQWHTALGELETPVDQVEDQSAGTANILYQRGLD